jgi:DNA repair protein RadC
MRKTNSIRKIKPDSYDESDKLISAALLCLENRLTYKTGILLNNSRNVSAYVRLQLAQEKNEVFSVLFLDNAYRLLAFEKMFYGTINETMIYPRCVIQKALEHNAAAVIAAHNHPSGNSKPSDADKEITKQLKTILEVMDVKLVDHLIVTHQETYSFAEKGIL